MIDSNKLKEIADNYSTPSYIFDIDALRNRVAKIREIVGDNIGLCYAMKANPFLTKVMSEIVDKLEVCSPGELDICKEERIDGSKIVYSGVNKTRESIIDAIKSGVGTYTAESVLHVKLLQEAVMETCNDGQEGTGCLYDKEHKFPVILRLSAGSQFGMSKDDIGYILDHIDEYPKLDFVGIHYFVGTQRKKLKDQIAELEMLHLFIEDLRARYSLPLKKLEYGPGLPVPYFVGEDFEDTLSPIKKLLTELQKATKWCDLTIEMGRFWVSTCGLYLSKVMDIKTCNGTNYCIIDGGINHVTYYGQVMGMKIPVIRHLDGGLSPTHGTIKGNADYALCGSLCTTADVLVRKVSFSDLKIGDILAFENMGAYSVTEGIYLFLSRMMPQVIMYENGRIKIVRKFVDTAQFNH